MLQKLEVRVKLFFGSITAIFSSGTFEDAAGAAEIASRTKGNLGYFYKALKKLEKLSINLTQKQKKVLVMPKLRN